MRELVVNADDFGFTRDVNAGIVHAHREGIVTSTTLMANGQAFDDAVQLAKNNPGLDLGVHVVLVGGSSLRTGRPLPKTLRALLESVLLRRLHPYQEGRAQVLRILAAGIRPSHIDTHKHTHLLPQVFGALIRLAVEFRIPFVRLPVFKPFDQPYRWYARRHGIRMSDHLLGYEWTGTLNESILLAAIPRLAQGWTELFCHPGYLGPELTSATTRLKESRVRELEALTSPRVRRAMDEAEVRLVAFCKKFGPPAP